MDHIEALDDEAVRSSLMGDLGFLLDVSNKAGALAGDWAIEKNKKTSAVARLVNSRKPEASLKDLYEKVAPILQLRKVCPTPGWIFKELNKREPKEYPQKKRRTTCRHIEDLLERLRINSVFMGTTKLARSLRRHDSDIVAKRSE